jgi:hypothetical protein
VSYALGHQERVSALILSGPLAAIDPVPTPLRLAARAPSARYRGQPLARARSAPQAALDP